MLIHKTSELRQILHVVGSAGFEPTTLEPRVLPSALLIVFSIKLLASILYHVRMADDPVSSRTLE
jgi:hypothetical protein